jgi:hypothetical protein
LVKNGSIKFNVPLDAVIDASIYSMDCTVERCSFMESSTQ